MFSITRDNKEYTLTDNELFKAYLIQQHQFDVDYVSEILDSDIVNNHPDIVEYAAWLYRDLLDKSDDDQSYYTTKVLEFVKECFNK